MNFVCRLREFCSFGGVFRGPRFLVNFVPVDFLGREFSPCEFLPRGFSLFITKAILKKPRAKIHWRKKSTDQNPQKEKIHGKNPQRNSRY